MEIIIINLPNQTTLLLERLDDETDMQFDRKLSEILTALPEVCFYHC